MPRISRRRGGAGKSKAHHVQTLQSSQQLVPSSKAINDPRDNPTSHLETVQNPTQGPVGFVADGIKRLELETSWGSVGALENAVNDCADSKINQRGFCTDLNAFEKSVDTAMELPVLHRSTSPSGSESDEVIIFSGRDRKKSQGKKPKVDAGFVKQEDNEGSPIVDKHSSYLRDPSFTCNLLDVREGESTSRATHSLPAEKLSLSSRKSDMDAILADYINNVRNNSGANDVAGMSLSQQRDLSLDDWTGHVEGFRNNQEGDSENQDKYEWNSIDLQDFDGFSSSSEPMDVAPHILRKRSKNSEIRYLAVAAGDSMDEARWLARDLLIAPAAADAIQVFEKEQSRFQPCVSDGDGDDGENEEGSALEAETTSKFNKDSKAAKDDKDCKEGNKYGISDQQIARLLSKQADFGLPADDLILFDEDGCEPESTHNEPPILTAINTPEASSQRENFKERSGISDRSANSSADALVRDAYDGFDIMDCERPSLRRRPKKGHLSQAVLDLSDSDLQHSILTAWESDRTRKKRRKEARESLRAQGLLGKNEFPDLKAKFTGGITMVRLKEEIKKFLHSSAESQPLPPMGQRERKQVHRTACKVGLKSKSVGTGVSRFPVLYKTSRTKTLTPGLEAQLDAILTPAKFLPRLDKSRQGKSPTSRSSIRGIATAASYRDGEIVGVDAPELGMENKGRAMLEKMGWSTGRSLGALDNKGITQPIEQIIKTSKAGLG